MSANEKQDQKFLVFLKNHRPTRFHYPKFIHMGIAPETPLTKRVKKKFNPPSNFFGSIGNFDDESNLSKLFKKQADKLLELGFDKCLQVPPDTFWGHINKLAGLANNIKPKKNCIPFLIVIPRYVMSLQKHASLLGIDCQGGGSKVFNKGGLPDMPDVTHPELPYLAVNVNLGMNFKGLSPNEASKKFGRWWRPNKLLPLTIDEGFAIATHAREILKSHTIDLIGAQFGTCGVPGIRDRDDGLWIMYRADDLGVPNSMPAFCHERMAV